MAAALPRCCGGAGALPLLLLLPAVGCWGSSGCRAAPSGWASSRQKPTAQGRQKGKGGCHYELLAKQGGSGQPDRAQAGMHRRACCITSVAGSWQQMQRRGAQRDGCDATPTAPGLA